MPTDPMPLSRRAAARASILSSGLILAAVPFAAAQELDASQFTQPEGISLYDEMPREALVARGEELFGDPSLSPNETTCMTCHAGLTGYNETFNQPYPHPVAMAQNRAGIEEVNAAEMVQLCMAVPMAAEPLDWRSPELAALAAYVEALQEEFSAQ